MTAPHSKVTGGVGPGELSALGPAPPQAANKLAIAHSSSAPERRRAELPQSAPRGRVDLPCVNVLLVLFPINAKKTGARSRACCSQQLKHALRICHTPPHSLCDKNSRYTPNCQSGTRQRSVSV